MSLILTVREELLARKGEWPEICRQTALSYWWVTKFAQARLDNPGVRKLELLERHFASNPRQSQGERPNEACRTHEFKSTLT